MPTCLAAEKWKYFKSVYGRVGNVQHNIQKSGMNRFLSLCDWHFAVALFDYIFSQRDKWVRVGSDFLLFLVHIFSGSFTFSSVLSWIPTTTLLLVLQLLILNESGLKFQIEADGLSPSAIPKISTNVLVPASSGWCVHSHCRSCPVRPRGNTEWAPRMHYDALTVFRVLNLHE